MATTHPIPRSTPEAQGVPSAALLAFVKEAERSISELHSFMLLRHGSVVAEGWWDPYGPQHPHMLFSLTKSFTSSAVGMAINEGRLSLEDRVLEFFPQDAPKRPSQNLQAMRVKHLLSMSTGHEVDATEQATSDPQGNWVRGFFAAPVQHEPGAPFVYNSAASHMLSAIVQKVTGQTLLDYLKPRLFDPLGIEGMTWQTDPMGRNTGGWGLALKTEDIARFGQMLLQKGLWEGNAILRPGWVVMATSWQVDNSLDPNQANPDWKQGYGFQFWMCRHNAFRGDGAFGQYCIVMPRQDAVLAITSGVGDMQAVLNLVWKQILPALGPAELTPQPGVQQQLCEKLESLQFAPPKGLKSTELAAGISGKVFQLEENPLKVQSLRLDFSDKGCSLTLADGHGEQALAAAHGRWELGQSSLFQGDPRHALVADVKPVPVAAGYAWTGERALQIVARFYETPFFYTLNFKFEGEQVTLEGGVNVSFGPTQMPTLVGKLA